MTRTSIDRRRFLAGTAGLSALALTGCASTGASSTAQVALAYAAPAPNTPAPVAAMYAAMPDEEFPIPAVPIEVLEPKYYRQIVSDPTGEKPGTIVVDTAGRFLYLVRDDGTAMRYGVGIGRQGFAWSGRAKIAYKRQWPTWTPPSEMIDRQPELEEWRHGMPPGPLNPLGARALYIFQDGKDTLYRLHGNPDVTSIGKAVSSGCVRLLQQDVIDLYGRVPDGSPILVI